MTRLCRREGFWLARRRAWIRGRRFPDHRISLATMQSSREPNRRRNVSRCGDLALNTCKKRLEVSSNRSRLVGDTSCGRRVGSICEPPLDPPVALCNLRQEVPATRAAEFAQNLVATLLQLFHVAGPVAAVIDVGGNTPQTPEMCKVQRHKQRSGVQRWMVCWRDGAVSTPQMRTGAGSIPRLAEKHALDLVKEQFRSRTVAGAQLVEVEVEGREAHHLRVRGIPDKRPDFLQSVELWSFRRRLLGLPAKIERFGEEVEVPLGPLDGLGPLLVRPATREFPWSEGNTSVKLIITYRVVLPNDFAP